MSWFVFALLAPAIWAIVNLLDDNLIRGIYKNPTNATIASGFLAILPLLSLFFIDIIIPSLQIVLIALAAGFLLISSYWLYYRSLLSEMPSVTIAIWKLSPIFLIFLASVFLGEVLTTSQYAGFALVLGGSIGISIINIKKLQFSKALVLMVLASILTATYAFLAKFVYSAIDFWSGFIFVSLGMGLGGIILIIISSNSRTFFSSLTRERKLIPIMILPGALNILGVFVFNLAVSRGPVSLVKVIEGIHPIYVLLFSMILYPFFPRYFREAAHTGKGRKVAFMLIMLVGLYLIY